MMVWHQYFHTSRTELFPLSFIWSQKRVDDDATEIASFSLIKDKVDCRSLFMSIDFVSMTDLTVQTPTSRTESLLRLLGDFGLPPVISGLYVRLAADFLDTSLFFREFQKISTVRVLWCYGDRKAYSDSFIRGFQGEYLLLDYEAGYLSPTNAYFRNFLKRQTAMDTRCIAWGFFPTSVLEVVRACGYRKLLISEAISSQTCAHLASHGPWNKIRIERRSRLGEGAMCYCSLLCSSATEERHATSLICKHCAVWLNTPILDLEDFTCGSRIKLHCRALWIELFCQQFEATLPRCLLLCILSYDKCYT